MINKYIIFLLLPLFLYAKSSLISNIPIPKTYIQNLDPYPCDTACLQQYVDNEKIFSFLSHAYTKLEDQSLDDIRMINVSVFNLGSNILSGELRIALLLPHAIIGRYATSTTNASFAYLMAKNNSFELKSYKIESESVEDITKAIIQIKEDGFYYVIAPLTQVGVNSVLEINPDINIYFPTINKKDINANSSYIYFGGIDYQAQSDMLLKEAVAPLSIFYDKSAIGDKLASYQEETFKNSATYLNSLYATDVNSSSFTQEEKQLAQNDIEEYIEQKQSIFKFLIPKRTTNLEKQLKENEEIKQGSFFINTPIVKSSMILSQLTLYDTNATNILSTQINYDPLILSMTQFIDRKNMIIANSITQDNNVLVETNSLLGNDIVFDWINYTTTVGVDYFFNQITNDDREYQIDIVDNQMIYPIELLRPSLSRFIKYTPPTHSLNSDINISFIE